MYLDLGNNNNTTNINLYFKGTFAIQVLIN